MFRPLTIEEAADLAAFACLVELAAEKPGNVTLRRGLPGLTPCDFLHSASALQAAFCRRRDRRVGTLVLDTIRRTRRVVQTNTNLGLALILAPLAIASARPAGAGGRRARRPASRSSGRARSPLRHRLRTVLRGLTVRDARQAYQAIRIAAPGGMGRVAREDISGPPRRDLRACMALAARRDTIASEYARDYALTFGVGAPSLREFLRAGLSMQDAIVMTFLRLLAHRPDSLIARERGGAAARGASRLATRVLRSGSTRTALGRRRLVALDHRLRASRLNPGTTADLTAAAIFVTLAE